MTEPGPEHAGGQCDQAHCGKVVALEAVLVGEEACQLDARPDAQDEHEAVAENGQIEKRNAEQLLKHAGSVAGE